MPGCMVLAVSEEEPIAYAILCGWLAEMGLGTPGGRAEFACSRWKPYLFPDVGRTGGEQCLSSTLSSPASTRNSMEA